MLFFTLNKEIKQQKKSRGEINIRTIEWKVRVKHNMEYTLMIKSKFIFTKKGEHKVLEDVGS